MGSEEQVWQRVFSGQEPRLEQGLGELLRQAQTLAARYRALLGKSQGRRRELLGRLHEGAQANADCLRWLLRLGGAVPGKPAPAGVRPPKLAECYHLTRRCLVEYAARSAEPEAGPVFRRMAQREEAHLALLAELLGRDEKSSP